MAAASGVAVVATSSPASAATPYCNNVSGVWDQAWGSTTYQTYRSSTDSYSVNCEMNRLNENGTAGERRAIRQLQRDLIECYFSTIVTIDGQYGANTKQAVKYLQQYLNTPAGGSHGLTVDGWAGPLTRRAMMHENVEQTFCVKPIIPIEINPDYKNLDV